MRTHIHTLTHTHMRAHSTAQHNTSQAHVIAHTRTMTHNHNPTQHLSSAGWRSSVIWLNWQQQQNKVIVYVHFYICAATVYNSCYFFRCGQARMGTCTYGFLCVSIIMSMFGPFLYLWICLWVCVQLAVQCKSISANACCSTYAMFQRFSGVVRTVKQQSPGQVSPNIRIGLERTKPNREQFNSVYCTVQDNRL